MYERVYAGAAGGDLYRLQAEARRRMGESSENQEPGEKLKGKREPSERETSSNTPVIRSLGDIIEEKTGKSIGESLFSKVKTDDLIIIALILLLVNEKADWDLIIVLALLLFMGRT